MNEERKYNREQVEQALQALADRLISKGQRSTLFLFGGAGLVLTTDFRRFTSDIDFDTWAQDYILPLYAKDLGFGRGGLPPFDNNVGLLASFKERCEQSFDHLRFFGRAGEEGDQYAPGLDVYVLKPGPQLAMKLSRAADKDMDDICHLCGNLGIGGVPDLEKFWSEYEPLVDYGMGAKVDKTNLAQLWPRIAAYAQKNGIRLPSRGVGSNPNGSPSPSA